MSSSYKGYYVITFLNVKLLKEILCDDVLVRQIPIMYVKFLCSQLDFPMGFLCIQKVLYCGFHCFIVRQNKSKQRIWNLTNMCPESLYICETEQIQNNEKSRNLYVSRKFPCTKSPNSWLSASSWTESKFKSSWTESKSLVAKILPYFDVLCLWLACLEQLHDVENNALKGQKISFQQNLGGSNIIWMVVTQEKNECRPRKIRLAPSWPHHRPGSLNHTFNPVSKRRIKIEEKNSFVIITFSPGCLNHTIYHHQRTK